MIKKMQYPLFLSGLDETFNYLDRLSKNTQISSFMKIRTVEAGVFHADGQT